MSSENWKPYTIEEIAVDVAMGPFGSNLKKDNFIDEGVPVIRGQNLNDNGFRDELFVFVSEDKAQSLKRSLAYPDELVFTHRGTLGQVAIIPNNQYPKYLVSQSQMRLEVNKKIVDPKFLYYFFKSAIGQYELLKNSSQVGVPAIASPTKSLKEIEVSLPPLPTQRRIGAILSSLDDKIELNRRMNQTLEAIAQSIFREWFVRFNFPGATGEMVETEVGEVPKGWRIARLADFIEIKHGFAFKGEFFSTEETDDILLTPGNFLIGGGFNYSKFKYYNGEVPDDYILQHGELIVTMTDLSKEGDTLGYSALVPTIQNKRLLHNQRIGKVILKEESPALQSFFYWLMRQNDYRHFVLSGATGTTVRHTSPSRISEFEFLLPGEETLQEFHKVFSSLQTQIEENICQSQTLTQVRDRLLPKLMRGGINLID